MERLTKSELVNGFPVCYPQNNTGLPEYVMKRNPYRKIVEKLKKYEDLEEQGKLLKLPCAVGDKIYEPRPDRGMVTEYRVSGLTYSGGEVFVGWQLNSGIYSNLDGVPANEIGKTVFTTKEEAEEALKRMEEENEVD